MGKAGYRTTEFWLSLLALLLGVVMSSGLIAPESEVAKYIGGALSILATLGYTSSRTKLKVAESESDTSDPQ